MNHSETVKLLAQMSAMDRRTIGDAEVMAWQSVLDDVDYADASQAVRQHYRESEDYLMPVHVRRLAAGIKAERERPAPSPWAPGQHGVRREEAQPEIEGPVTAQGVSPRVAGLLSQLRTMLPKGSREDLMPRRVDWERQHRAFVRVHQAQPNPWYRGGGTSCMQEVEHAPHEWAIDGDKFYCHGSESDSLYQSLPCVGTWECTPEHVCGGTRHWWQEEGGIPKG